MSQTNLVMKGLGHVCFSWAMVVPDAPCQTVEGFGDEFQSDER